MTTSSPTPPPLAAVMVKELPAIPAQNDKNSNPTSSSSSSFSSSSSSSPSSIRCFSLFTNNGVTVEVCSLGASITKLELPTTFKRSSSSSSSSSSNSGSRHSESSSPATQEFHDCVLGYNSPATMLSTGNPVFFGVIVGRVANRIKDAKFSLRQPKTNSNNHQQQNQQNQPSSVSSKSNNDESNITTTATTLTEYQLEANDGLNHLHGGVDGFGRRIWEAEIVSIPSSLKKISDHASNAVSAAQDENVNVSKKIQKGVQFTLVSKDGDQGYPGTLKATATYTLEEKPDGGVALCLEMRANLLSPLSSSSSTSTMVRTPINLAQHSYFNLHSHDSRFGIMGHKLTLPNSHAYTRPLVGTGLVEDDDDHDDARTKKVRPVQEDPVMDFRAPPSGGKTLAAALAKYGMEKVGLDKETAWRYVKSRAETIASPPPPAASSRKDVLSSGAVDVKKQSDSDSSPPPVFGLDHNYVISHPDTKNDNENYRNGSNDNDNLTVAAILEDQETGRRMTVKTNAPGIQVYTSNYLNAVVVPKNVAKDRATYHRWQALCLETQHYPDSIIPDDDDDDDDNDGDNIEKGTEFLFTKGKCVILPQPGGQDYVHCVQYHFDSSTATEEQGASSSCTSSCCTL